MDKINYAEKILNFNLIVGNQNEDIAYKYLSQTNWDESKAAQIFNEDTKKMEESLTRYLHLKERKLKMQPKHISIYPVYKIDSINSIFNKITYYFKDDNNKYFHRFSKIKNAVQSYDDFINKLKDNKKTGVVILYSTSHIRLIKDQFKNILNEPLSKELLFDNSVIYPVIDTSPEGDNFISELNIEKLPLFIICKFKNDESLAIISKLEIPFKLCDFRDNILESEQAYFNKTNSSNNNSSISQKNKNNNLNSINNINKINEENKDPNYINNNNENNKKEYIPDYNDYDFEDDENIDFIYNMPENNIKMSDGQVLAIQELKLRELEKMEEKKQNEEKRILEEKEKYQNIIDKEMEESKKILQNLKPEPDDENPDKCIILFRFPDGEKSVQRKFLKQDKISLLYDYIKSLGRDIFTENDHHHFSLLQTFPFKLFDDKKDNTLEEEGLFPNSVLQIKELE